MNIFNSKAGKRKFFDCILLCFWVVVITALSLLPSGKVSVDFLFFKQADKLFHFVFYFGFALLLFRILYNSKLRVGRSLLIVAAVIPIVYSGIIELAQEYLVATRNADFFDFAFNIIGAVSAIVLYRYLLRFEFNHFYTREFS